MGSANGGRLMGVSGKWISGDGFGRRSGAMGWSAAMADLMGLAGFARARSWVNNGMAMRPWQRAGGTGGAEASG